VGGLSASLGYAIHPWGRRAQRSDPGGALRAAGASNRPAGPSKASSPGGLPCVPAPADARYAVSWMAGGKLSRRQAQRVLPPIPLREPRAVSVQGRSTITCHAELAPGAGPQTALEAQKQCPSRQSRVAQAIRLVALAGRRSARVGAMNSRSDGASPTRRLRYVRFSSRMPRIIRRPMGRRSSVVSLVCLASFVRALQLALSIVLCRIARRGRQPRRPQSFARESSRRSKTSCPISATVERAQRACWPAPGGDP